MTGTAGERRSLRRSLHVLQVLRYQPPFPGGVVRSMAALGRALRERGGRATYAFPARRDWFDLLEPAGEVLVLPEIEAPLWRGLPRVLDRLVREREVDLVHAHFSFAVPLSLALFRPRFRVPLVYHWHNPPRVLQSGRHVSRYRALLRPAAGVLARTGGRAIARPVVISHEIEQLLLDHGWVRPGRTALVPNAVGFPDAAPGRDGRGPGFTVVSVANFRTQKDHPTLIRSFRILADAVPESRLLLVGDGPTREGMERLAAELEIGSRVRFLGFVEDLSGVVSSADVFALATHYEGHPLSVMEAMSHGVPVVGSDIPSLRDLVTSGVHGFLVRPGDPEEMARRFLELHGDRELAARLGGEGRNRIARDFSESRWIRDLLDVYGAAVDGG